MKGLFVSKVATCRGGGSVISCRNYELFINSVEGDIIRYDIGKNKVFSCSLIDRCFKHYVNGINANILMEVSKLAKDCEYVWVDNSSFGAIAKKLKESNYKGTIIVFFHNIEYIFQKRSFFKRLLYPIFNLPIKKAEEEAAQYADLIFVLTDRKSVV